MNNLCCIRTATIKQPVGKCLLEQGWIFESTSSLEGPREYTPRSVVTPRTINFASLNTLLIAKLTEKGCAGLAEQDAVEQKRKDEELEIEMQIEADMMMEAMMQGDLENL